MNKHGVMRTTAAGKITWDVPVILSVPGLPDLSQHLTMVTTQESGGWTAYLLRADGWPLAATIMDLPLPTQEAAIAAVFERLTIDVIPEWKESE